jgi:hypothetical protein
MCTCVQPQDDTGDRAMIALMMEAVLHKAVIFILAAVRT